MSPNILDKVCEEFIREEADCVKNLISEPIPQCGRCNFLATIKIESYREEIVERLFHRIKYVLNVILTPSNCLRMKEGLYVEARLSDNDLRETRFFRFATAISNALNLTKKDEEYLVIKLFSGGSYRKKDACQYDDFATSVSPLKVGKLARFLQKMFDKMDIVGCIKIEDVNKA